MAHLGRVHGKMRSAATLVVSAVASAGLIMVLAKPAMFASAPAAVYENRPRPRTMTPPLRGGSVLQGSSTTVLAQAALRPTLVMIRRVSVFRGNHVAPYEVRISSAATVRRLFRDVTSLPPEAKHLETSAPVSFGVRLDISFYSGKVEMLRAIAYLGGERIISVNGRAKASCGADARVWLDISRATGLSFSALNGMAGVPWQPCATI